jgi:hypothetical protein
MIASPFLLADLIDDLEFIVLDISTRYWPNWSWHADQRRREDARSLSSRFPNGQNA